jgi:hypothetical protein
MGTDLVPLLPLDQAEEPDVAAMLRAWDRADIASRILKASILLVTAGAIALELLSAGNPLALFAKARASLMGTSQMDSSLTAPSTTGMPAPQDATGAPQDGAGQLAQVIRPTAIESQLPPIPIEAPKDDEIATPVEAADQSQTVIRQQPAEDLLKQFQAWVAEDDARARVEPTQSVENVPPAEPVEPAQETRTQVAQAAGPQVVHVQRHRPIRHVQNARAEIRPDQNARAQAPLAKNPRAEIRRTAPIRPSQPPQDPFTLGRD